MMTANVITRIKQNSTFFNENEAEIGAISDYVYIPGGKNGEGTPLYLTLTDFFQYVQNFFTEGSFISWGADAPASDNLQVKIWYQTPPKQTNG